jgi:hypothetical protein
MFTITELGITGELARCLATTNVIESPNSVVRRVSGRVTNYKDAEMALRWTAAGFLEAEKSFKKLRGHADLKTLINGPSPRNTTTQEGSIIFMTTDSNLQLSSRHRHISMTQLQSTFFCRAVQKS